MTDIETWSIKGVLNEGYFYVKICKKYASEASPRALLILINSSKQSMHARNSFENKIFWKRIIKKPSKNLLDFSFAPSPFLRVRLRKTNGAWD